MSSHVLRSRKRRRAYASAAAGLLLSAPLVAQVVPGARDVSGTVTDGHHEPLRGAVVQIEDEASQAVMTYVTDKTGHYEFKRIRTDDDYRLTATYRGHHSRPRELSKFNSKPAPVFALVIRPS